MTNTTKPVSLNAIVTETPKAEPETAVEVFDFTLSPVVMGELTKMAYYLLRRKAMLANRGRGDKSLMPYTVVKEKVGDVETEKQIGKKMTRAEVEAILETTIEQAAIDSKCCGK